MEKYRLIHGQEINGQQGYINDFATFDGGRLVNCYNNGALSTWDLGRELSNDLKPISYRVLHDSFVYKLRKVDDYHLLTASNDFTAKLYDVEHQTVVDTF